MRTKPIIFSLALALVLTLLPISTAGASRLADISVTDDRAALNFPDSITFSADLQSEAVITSVVLEYGSEQLTCGTVVAMAFPQFTPGKSISAEWTWEMKQSGSLPPGTQIWWRWRVMDESGREIVTDSQTITWLDEQHDWQTISGGNIRLHWYDSGRAFGQELHTAAVQGLARLEQDAGLVAEQPVDLYIYANTTDMRDAILYEPSWTGGMAFPGHSIVIIGIAPSDLDWGKDTIVHELTHVLVGHLTFSCLGDVPTWLNEGLAVYSEGELEAYSRKQLDDAIADDKLFSVRSLSGGFSEIPDRADLSYSESYSIVKFLIEQYGRDKMTALLLALRDGAVIDEALAQTYGFNVDGLEDAWRDNIGAQPRAIAPNPTATPQPTPVPTIVPISGAPLVVTPTPLSVVDETPAAAAQTETDAAPASIPAAIWASAGCLVMLLSISGAFLFYRRRNADK